MLTTEQIDADNLAVANELRKLEPTVENINKLVTIIQTMDALQSKTAEVAKLEMAAITAALEVIVYMQRDHNIPDAINSKYLSQYNIIDRAIDTYAALGALTALINELATPKL